MDVGGFQEFSLIDYPGKLCAIVFTQGCNFRCPYCHNSDLVEPKKFMKKIPEEEIFTFLEERKGKLDAVSITGGEPTLQKDLIDFIIKSKKMGFLVKLDTNGSNPEILKKIFKKGIVDYISMDVKAPPEKYSDISGSKIDTSKIKNSIELIKNSGLNYEFRTTLVKDQLTPEDIEDIGKFIKGAKNYVLQKFIPKNTLDPEFLKKETYSEKEFEEFRIKLEKYVEVCKVRL